MNRFGVWLRKVKCALLHTHRWGWVCDQCFPIRVPEDFDPFDPETGYL